MTLWTIRADYDSDAAAWWVVDSDLPGLAADAPTLAALADKIGAFLPDLLDINGGELIDPTRREGPHRLRIVAHHEQLFDVAA